MDQVVGDVRDQWVEYFKPRLRPQWLSSPRLRRTARLDLGARAALSDHAARLPHPRGDVGDDARRSPALSGHGTSPVVRGPLANRNQSATFETNAATGRAALEVGRRHSQRNPDDRDRVQSGAAGDAGSGRAATSARRADQFRSTPYGGWCKPARDQLSTN